MQSTHHTGEGEGEKRGRATGQREAGPYTLSETHTRKQQPQDSRRTVCGSSTNWSGFYRGSGTSAGLAALGSSKAGSLLILSGGGVTPGDVWSVGGEFPDSGKE